MAENLIAAAASGLIGFGIAFISYIISKTILKKAPEKYAATTLLRQVLQLGFIFAAFIIGRKTGFDATYILVGGVLGLTVPMFFFTKKLLGLNETLYKTEKRKETETDG